MSDALVLELKRLLGDDAVLTAPEDRARYEEGWRYGKGRALLVARPGTTDQVAATLKACQAVGVRVVPQGANTGLVGASTPDASGDMVVLSLERLNRRLEIDAVNRTVSVDGGVLLSSLNDALVPHGLMYPIDLGADPSVGGMIATNTGGTRLLKYGDVRHNLLGLEVVLADGTVLEAMNLLRKNNTGLDVKQLFVGTSGTFGVITGAVLQVVPMPGQQATALVGCTSGAAVLELLQVLEHHLADVFTAFEVISAEALVPVFRHHEGLRNPFGGSGAPPYTVLVELATTLPATALDLPGLLEERLGAILESGAGEGLTDVLMGKPEDFWAIRHHVSESLRREGRVLAFDLSVPRSRMADFSHAARTFLASEYPFVRCCDFGHWGDGGTHLNLVWTEAESPCPASELVPVLQARIYDLAVLEFEGSYSAEHGVGPHNQRFYEAYTAAPVRALNGVLKAHLDPLRMLGTTRLD